MKSLTVDADIDADEDLFGKTVSDLQSGIVISNGTISGTLKYVADYSSAFGPDLDSGNYIALHCTVPDAEDAIITVTVANPSVLDEDGIIVCRIANKSSQTIRVVASKEGYPDVIKTFTLNGLTCEDS